MRSRVLSEDTADAQPVPWRRNLPIPVKAAKPVDPGTPDEVFQLRTKITELTAIAEQQSRKAYEQGLRAGEAAARKGLEAEVRAVIDRLAKAVADVNGARADTVLRAEADTVRLAIEIARRVLHRELSVDPNALEALTKAALAKLQSQEIHRVRIHPAQEALVRASLQHAGRGTGIEIVADPSQPQGGVLFEITRGALDASVGTQLDEIERGLTDLLEARG